MKKLTHKQIVFLALLHAPRHEYVPVFTFIGEKFMCGKWHFMSHKCPARLSDIFKDIPNVIQRKKIRGKSGSLYYTYRIDPEKRTEALHEHLPEDYKRVFFLFRNKKEEKRTMVEYTIPETGEVLRAYE